MGVPEQVPDPFAVVLVNAGQPVGRQRGELGQASEPAPGTGDAENARLGSGHPEHGGNSVQEITEFRIATWLRGRLLGLPVVVREEVNSGPKNPGPDGLQKGLVRAERVDLEQGRVGELTADVKEQRGERASGEGAKFDSSVNLLERTLYETSPLGSE